MVLVKDYKHKQTDSKIMNNHEMVQLRTDSLEDPEEGQLRDAMGVQSPRQKHEGRCKRCIRCIGFILLIIACLVIGLTLCFVEGVSGVYLFDKIDRRN